MLDNIYNDANSRMDQAVKHTQMELMSSHKAVM